jgi:hypothetical protein
MGATSDITNDLQVIGLIGRDETGGGVALQQSSKNPGIGCVAAQDAMRAELKHIANSGHRQVWIRFERPLL